MKEKKGGPENYTMEDLLERFDYLRMQLIKNKAAMIVALQKVALEPGFENPQLHLLAAELGSNHLNNDPLLEVLNRFPDVYNRPLSDIFGENINVVTGLLALPTGEEQSKDIEKPKIKIKKEKGTQPKTQEKKPVEITEFLKQHPQVKGLFADQKLWVDGDENSWIQISKLDSQIMNNFIVNKSGNPTRENLVYAFYHYQKKRFLKEFPQAIEYQTEGKKQQEMMSQTSVLDLFIHLSYLKENNFAKYRLVDSSDLPQADVKKNVNKKP